MGPKYPTNRYVVVLLLVMVALVGASGLPLGRWNVHIVNKLNNDVLAVHCKSKDNDLRYQRLVPGADFHWSFRVNVWGTTLFWCNLQKSSAYASFDTFWPESKNQWLRYRCTDRTKGNCIWTAKDDGIYLKNIPDNVEELVHKWTSS
ncbi:S-protein homolog 74-like [Momordica charantia]|uniref:S-protein homolog n=1 Tax=Momordica charantia TaxID=3673 RepID=A0A6J1CS23_MOMCH|nr:S-protein homolog 74-like [Momordica charantia]